MKSICKDKQNINTVDRWSLATYLLIFIGLVVRLVYVFNTTVFERNHDVGCFTSLTDGQINPGHLGYIEYIVKFGQLPQINPFDLFSYYHPPLHHLLGALVVKASLLFGASYEAAFENIQLFTVLIGILCLFVALKIIRFFANDNAFSFLGMVLLTFHPALIYMSGYVNNDMLTLLFEELCIFFTLRWLNKDSQDKNIWDLICMALSIGLGMCVKISVVLFAAPMGVAMLLELLKTVRACKENVEAVHKYRNVMRLLVDYVVFGIISIGLGLSWTVRNIIKFHQKPGIASATPEDIKYMGNWPILKRIGLPVNMEFKYPFFNEYGSVSSNIWDIMFKTSMFGEMRPDIPAYAIVLCRMLLIIAIFGFVLLTIVSVARFIRMATGRTCYSKETGIFLLIGFLAVLLSYVAFTIKYPYTCSCDFRYIIVILVYFAITIAGFCKKDNV